MPSSIYYDCTALLTPVQEMGDIKYLLSPQDLMAVEQVPELIAAGVSCFKIEGEQCIVYCACSEASRSQWLLWGECRCLNSWPRAFPASR